MMCTILIREEAVIVEDMVEGDTEATEAMDTEDTEDTEEEDVAVVVAEEVAGRAWPRPIQPTKNSLSVNLL